MESIKDGVAQVRVSPTLVVQASLASGSGQEVGSKVALVVAPDGTMMVKSAGNLAKEMQAQTLQILLDSLPSLVGVSTAGAMAKSLARGDLEATRQQITEIWKQLQSSLPDSVVPQLRSWLEQKAPALLSRPGEAPTLAGSVALSLGAPTENVGEYFAQIAGQPAKLLGPTDLTQGAKGLWQARQMPGGAAVWAPLPARAVEVGPRPLPPRVPADISGAENLLEWAQVAASPEEVLSLGQFLEHVGRDFQTQGGRESASPDGGSSRPTAAASGDSIRSADGAGKSLDRTPAVVPEKSVDLPKAVAERTLVAWALELPDEPVVRRAVLGEGPALPQALETLAKAMVAVPGAHPGLEVVLSEIGSRDWLDPQGSKPQRHGTAIREKLAEAVFEALSEADSSPAQMAVREALQQTASALVQENLQPPRDRAQEYPATAFQARGPEGKLEEGKIVVHDRRSRKKSPDSMPDHHTVEIEMRPTELGAIKAKLDLRGKVLSTRLEARETETASLLDAHAGELREAFKKIGLEPAKIDVERPAFGQRVDPRKRGSGLSLDLRV